MGGASGDDVIPNETNERSFKGSSDGAAGESSVPNDAPEKTQIT